MLMTATTLAGLMIAASAYAQTSGPTSGQATSGANVDDIVCSMSGTCGVTDKPSDADHQKVGDEKMFSLQKTEGAPQSTGQKVGDEKMFSLQKADTPAAPQKTGQEKMFSMQAADTPAPAAKPGKGKHSKHSAAPAAPSQPVHELAMQVRFETGSADLTDDTKAELGKYVTALNRPELSSMKFAIEGHTDSTGARATNLDLSQRRAQSVVDYLVANGVSSDRLSAKGYGPDKPLSGVSKKSPLNRRVELVRVD